MKPCYNSYVQLITNCYNELRLTSIAANANASFTTQINALGTLVGNPLLPKSIKAKCMQHLDGLFSDSEIELIMTDWEVLPLEYSAHHDVS